MEPALCKSHHNKIAFSEIGPSLKLLTVSLDYFMNTNLIK